LENSRKHPSKKTDFIKFKSKKITVKIIFRENLKSSKNFKKTFLEKTTLGKGIWKTTENIV